MNTYLSRDRLEEYMANWEESSVPELGLGFDQLGGSSFGNPYLSNIYVTLIICVTMGLIANTYVDKWMKMRFD